MGQVDRRFRSLLVGFERKERCNLGFLDQFWGRKGDKKPVRGKSRPIEERLKAEELRQLKRLEREDPIIARQFWLRRLGLERDEQDKLESALDVIQKLQDRGLIPESADKLSGDTWLREIGKGIAMGLGPALMTMMTRPPTGLPYPPMYPPVQVPIQAPTQVQAPEQPAQSELPAKQPQPATPDTEPAPATQQESVIPDDVSESSKQLIALFADKSPEEAVALIASHPQARLFGQGLLMVPEEQLLLHLHSLEMTIPDLAGFVAWLRSRPTWLVAVVRGLRAQLQVG